MDESSGHLEEKIDEIMVYMKELTALLADDRTLPPIIPLEVAAERFFQRKPALVLKWVKDGHLRAYAVPNGKRRQCYYFLAAQLIEDLESNFTK
ncbi:hypothetical protein [Cerasicoccus fimbriatus]|uniref:hypothetical protein n=1 Tax=Cerasicoccus fimbriatus TaxID=3014554 RepID=UPI0022B34FCB|nr:hypothetical protein [Cerasicoccus sp. TK19100]